VCIPGNPGHFPFPNSREWSLHNFREHAIRRTTCYRGWTTVIWYQHSVGGRVGHGSRESDGRAWVCESSRAQGPRSSLHYTTLRRWLGDGRGVATRLAGRLQQQIEQSCRSGVLSDNLFRGVAMTFCQGSKAHHFSRWLKARITVIWGYPLPLRLMGFLKTSNVSLAISGIFRRGLVGIKTRSVTLLTKYFFSM